MKGKKARVRIKRELPPVGTKLKARYKGKGYSARIVKDKYNPSGRAVKYNDNLYKSMTAAAKIITKHSVNGWQFWKF
ncbi:DUF4357 domain-containing protein [bacterium]|nr:DUF4357 domain-containing protein [bacterium]